MAPTVSPSTFSGMPPISAEAPCSASAPRRPSVTCCSISRLGRMKIAAVRALSRATRELAIWASLVRRNATSSPQGSTTAMTTRWPCSTAYRSAASRTAAAPASSMILRVRTAAMGVAPPWSGAGSGERGGPDRFVGGDEEDVPLGPAEAEVDGAGQLDLADEVAAPAEDLDAAEGRGVDAPFGVDLQTVGEARGHDGEQALPRQAAAVDDVEGLDVVRAVRVVGPGLLVRAAVGDVQHMLVGREADAVRLVEAVRHDRGRSGGRVVAIDVVAEPRLGAETLEVAVARIGEPDRAVALHDHVVGRVERKAAPVVDECLGRREVGDPGMPRSRSLLADHEATLTVEGHAVRDVRVRADHRDSIRLQWETVAIERHALDGHRRGAGSGHSSGERREVEGVLVGYVDGALVRVRRDYPDQARRVAQDSPELLVMGDERGEGGGGTDAAERARLTHSCEVRRTGRPLRDLSRRATARHRRHDRGMEPTTTAAAVRLRPGRAEDAPELGRIIFEAFGAVAEHDGRTVGSNFLAEGSTIAGIGPISVDPALQDSGVGGLMMRDVMERARSRGLPGVRLVQTAYHIRSLSLYM